MHQADVGEYTPERIEEHVEVRMRRQTLLTRDPPLQLSVVIDEAVLHREVGGPAVMGTQLDHLVEMAMRPNVMLQVIPYKAGAHPAMDSTFNILDFGEAASSLVYVEGLMGFLYIEKPEDINRFREIFEYLHNLALSPQDSVELVTKTRARAQYNSAALLASGDSGK
jgi:hypothetical protein